MEAPRLMTEGTKTAADLQIEVVAGLRTAADGLNAAAAEVLQAAVADGLLAAAESLVETGNRLKGEVASGLRVAGYGLRHAAKFLRAVICSRCGLVHSDYDSIAWDEGLDKFDCRVLFHDAQSRNMWLEKNNVVVDSEVDDDLLSFVPDSLAEDPNFSTDESAK